MFKVKFKFNCILVDIVVNYFKYIAIIKWFLKKNILVNLVSFFIEPEKNSEEDNGATLVVM